MGGVLARLIPARRTRVPDAGAVEVAADPHSRALEVTRSIWAIGQIVPPPLFCVFSITRSEVFAKWMEFGRTCGTKSSTSKSPRAPSTICPRHPASAAGPPVSYWKMCESRCATIPSPCSVWARSAVWLAMVPEGGKAGRLLPHDLGDPLLEADDRRIIAEHVIPDLGISDGPRHAPAWGG